MLCPLIFLALSIIGLGILGIWLLPKWVKAASGRPSCSKQTATTSSTTSSSWPQNEGHSAWPGVVNSMHPETPRPTKMPAETDLPYLYAPWDDTKQKAPKTTLRTSVVRSHDPCDSNKDSTTDDDYPTLLHSRSTTTTDPSPSGACQHGGPAWEFSARDPLPTPEVKTVDSEYPRLMPYYMDHYRLTTLSINAFRPQPTHQGPSGESVSHEGGQSRGGSGGGGKENGWSEGEESGEAGAGEAEAEGKEEPVGEEGDGDLLEGKKAAKGEEKGTEGIFGSGKAGSHGLFSESTEAGESSHGIFGESAEAGPEAGVLGEAGENALSAEHVSPGFEMPHGIPRKRSRLQGPSELPGRATIMQAMGEAFWRVYGGQSTCCFYRET